MAENKVGQCSVWHSMVWHKSEMSILTQFLIVIQNEEKEDGYEGKWW